MSWEMQRMEDERRRRSLEVGLAHVYRNRAVVPTEWFHRDYRFDLSKGPQEVIRAEFENMLGTHLHRIQKIGVVRDEAHLQHLYRLVAQANNEASRNARGRRWTKLKVIRWRGCYAITSREVWS